MIPAETADRGGVTRTELFKAGLRSLFLESSFTDEGRQNIGAAAVLDPILERLDPGRGPEERLRLLRPFSTNPIMSGLVFGAAISFEEESARSGVREADRDELVACLASAGGAKGDQLFWNTWLQFSSLTAFFFTWRFGLAWGPLLLPLIFLSAAFPVRLFGVFRGYNRGVAAASGRLNASVLTLRRRLQTFILFAEGFVTALILDSVPGTEGLASPQVLFFAAAFFLAVLLGLTLVRRLPQTAAPVYLLEAGVLYLILTRL